MDHAAQRIQLEDLHLSAVQLRNHCFHLFELSCAHALGLRLALGALPLFGMLRLPQGVVVLDQHFLFVSDLSPDPIPVVTVLKAWIVFLDPPIVLVITLIETYPVEGPRLLIGCILVVGARFQQT